MSFALYDMRMRRDETKRDEMRSDEEKDGKRELPGARDGMLARLQVAR